ncbi:membrane protein [Streptomyces noursei ATCC 11455]|nr:membrane protein [Streptomyces noursei ATCC 11455]
MSAARGRARLAAGSCVVRCAGLLGAVTGLRGWCAGLLALYVLHTTPSGPSPPVVGHKDGEWELTPVVR